MTEINKEQVDQDMEMLGSLFVLPQLDQKKDFLDEFKEDLESILPSDLERLISLKNSLDHSIRKLEGELSNGKTEQVKIDYTKQLKRMRQTSLFLETRISNLQISQVNDSNNGAH